VIDPRGPGPRSGPAQYLKHARRGAPIGANRLLATVKTFFAFAVEQTF
jgi:hypothetical protein